ncbi:protein FAM200C-like [Oratosquilla oratoria]|uniref:protein FAM200C-like n=1 Tax=Oratosquilla oratoria TaxID=337810 RepID=UPI003F75BF1B
MIYVRFLNDAGELAEEVLFARSLMTDNKGEPIFKEVSDYFQKRKISMSNIIACATDGAAAMVGRYRGFIAYLKETVPNLLCIHCVVHRQHLVAKNLSGRLKNVLDSVVMVVNRVKSNPLQERLFRQLCADNEEFKSLLLHTEVRWLSKGNCLNRFVELWPNVELFLNGTEVGKEVIAAKSDIFYQADIFEKLNILNKQLQSGHTAKARFKHGFWNSWTSKEIAVNSPLLWEKVELYIFAFPTTYLEESGFSKVSQLLSKARNHLEIIKRGDLRLCLTSMDPNIEELAKRHQTQGSH